MRTVLAATSKAVAGQGPNQAVPCQLQRTCERRCWQHALQHLLHCQRQRQQLHLLFAASGALQQRIEQLVHTRLELLLLMACCRCCCWRPGGASIR